MIKDTKIGVKGMEVWKKSPLFHGMTEQKIEEILMQEQCRRKKYEKGTFVFLEGDVPKSLFLLIQGKVTISQSTMSGRRILLTDITRSGDLFGEVYLFIGKEAYDMDATGSTASALAAFIAAILIAWFGGSLFQVAVIACVVVFVLEMFIC